MTIYYTEWPTTHFGADNDTEALEIGKNCLIIYKESDTEDGRPFIMVKDEYSPELEKTINKPTWR